MDGQFKKVKQHILEQWYRTLGREEKKEAEELLQDQQADANARYVLPKFVEARERSFQELVPKKRLILVAVMSRVFTYKEISQLMGVSVSTVEKVVEDYRKSREAGHIIVDVLIFVCGLLTIFGLVMWVTYNYIPIDR